MAHALKIMNHRETRVGLSANTAQSRNNKGERPFQFVAALRPKILARKKRAERFVDIAAGATKSRGDSAHGLGWRIIGDKTPAKFRRNVQRCRRMTRHALKNTIQIATG